jgi:ECF sigma factor
MADAPREITNLLLAWSGGDDSALEKLLPHVYQELRRIAQRHMYGERPGHTLQTTALVNEAYLRLIDTRQVRWQDRAHFFAVSAQLMRWILVDFARSREYQKRGGGAQQVTLDEGLIGPQEKGPRSGRSRRRTDRTCLNRRKKIPRRGIALLRRSQRRGNSPSPNSFLRHGAARLAVGQSLVG